MAVKITNCYIERFPRLRLIGKRYTQEDKVTEFFGEQWNEWHREGWFCLLYEANELTEEGNKGPLGLVVVDAQNRTDYVYWIGLLFPPNTPVPEGFSYLDLPKSRVGVVWVYGNDNTNELFGKPTIEMALEHLESKDIGTISTSVLGSDTIVFFERFNCPRFTNPDEKGNIILDYGFFLEQ